MDLYDLVADIVRAADTDSLYALYELTTLRNVLEPLWLAGVKGGYVAGETNKTASKVTKDPYTISDINATIAHLLGIEAEKERFSPTGRPFKVANKGEVIKDILA